MGTFTMLLLYGTQNEKWGEGIGKKKNKTEIRPLFLPHH